MSAKSVVGAVFGSLAVGLIAGVFVTTILTVAIWPGEAKLTAPLFCPDDRSEAIVVRDESRTSDGSTSIDYSMYCVGERGEVTEIGFLRPFAVLTVVHALIIALVAGVLGLRRRGRQEAERDRIRRQAAGLDDPQDPAYIPTSTPGPFVN